MGDCLNRGWVLDGYPKTIRQAILLREAGIIPNAVFSMQLDLGTLKIRAYKEFNDISRKNEIKRVEALKKYSEKNPDDDTNVKLNYFYILY